MKSQYLSALSSKLASTIRIDTYSTLFGPEVNYSSIYPFTNDGQLTTVLLWIFSVPFVVCEESWITDSQTDRRLLRGTTAGKEVYDCFVRQIARRTLHHDRKETSLYSR